MENIVKDLKDKLNERETELERLNKDYQEVKLSNTKLNDDLESIEIALEDTQHLVT